jgi:DNA-binding SARP family transcriptional activator
MTAPDTLSPVRYEVRLLGPWELRAGGNVVPVRGSRLRVLLTSLVLAVNQTVTTDTLVEQLWPERPPEWPRRSLHTYVTRLRQLLEPGLIHTQPGIGYQLSIAPEAIDLHRFRDLVARAKETASMDEELRLLRAALALWRGTPFADLHSTWLDREVVPGLSEEWFAATLRRVELELDLEFTEQLIGELQELVNSHPTREQLWRCLITAMHRAGRRAEALDAYQRIRAILRDELGIEPGEQLVALQQQILLDGSADTVAPALRQLPHDIPTFTGRDDELTTLDTLLAGAGRTPAPVIVSVTGAPGVGKTTLAVHWAHRIADRYPDTQLYLDLRGYGPGEPLSPSAAAETLLRALGVDSALIPADLDARSALFRSRMSGTEALVVLDNARDAEHVRPLLPGGSAVVVVTSRDQLRGLSVRDGAHRVTLRPLSRRKAVEMLGATFGTELAGSERAAAAELVELCGRLPLALAIAAELAQRAGSLADIVATLRAEKSRLDRLHTGEESPDGIRTALSWSYRALTPHVATMFRRLGLHPAGTIDVRAAAELAGVPVEPATVWLDRLVAAHLVEQRRPHRYELHDLIRLYAGDMAAHELPGDREAAIQRVLDWYLHAAMSADEALIPERRRDFLGPCKPRTPPPEFTSPRDAHAWFERECDSLRAYVDWAGRSGFAGHAWRIAMAMTTFFDHTIPGHEGVAFYRSALVAARTAGELEGEAHVLNAMGLAHLDLSEPDAAASCFHESLQHFRTLTDPWGEAMALGNLALVHGERGDVATPATARCGRSGCARTSATGAVWPSA